MRAEGEATQGFIVFKLTSKFGPIAHMTTALWDFDVVPELCLNRIGIAF